MKSAREITINYLKDILEDRLNAKTLYEDKYSQGYFDINDECLLLQQVIAIVKESEGE